MATTAATLRRNQYFDSVFLMRLASRLQQQPEIEQAGAVMGTPANKELLAEAGFRAAEIDEAGPNDLVVTVRAADAAVAGAALAKLDELLAASYQVARADSVRSLDEALHTLPEANVALISVPGEHAAREARLALERGLNVFLFSDNVPLDSELELKRLARERGLLVMGPDCGTAIVKGVGLGFANAVRRGPIGVVGASGTGIQEVTTLVHRGGSGISHALGTGSRDASDEVGGTSTLTALEALEEDAQTQVIALVSKPPGEDTLRHLKAAIDGCTKPVVSCFLGVEPRLASPEPGSPAVATLDEAARVAVRLATGHSPEAEAADLEPLLDRERSRRGGHQRYVRGLFAGGSFCYQAQLVLSRAGLEVRSNAPLQPWLQLADPRRSKGHSAVDMGADDFTRGRPHPMIDARQRQERILAEADDPETAVLLLDFILGYGSSSEPVGDLAPALAEARRRVEGRGDHLSVVASVCGTDGDPQDLGRQTELLRELGAVVLPSQAQAADFAARLVVAVRA